MKKIVPVYPWPIPSVLAAKLAEIEQIAPVEAKPGGPGPILAIKEPPFVCDAILVKDPERVRDAVNIIINNGIELVSMRDQIATIVGGEVVEMQVPYVSRVKFE